MTTPQHEHDIHQITGARMPHSQDQGSRIRRYLISMLIRTACVVAAVVVEGPMRWVFIAGAVVLPYVAVVMANAVGTGRTGGRRAAPARSIALPSGQAGDSPGAVGESPDADRPHRRSAAWSRTGSPH